MNLLKLLITFHLLMPFALFAQTITTFVGNGTMGYSGDGGPASNAKMVKPVGVNFDNYGNLLICHEGVIRKVNLSTGIITTIAGDGTALTIGNDGLAMNALINDPRSVSTDATDNIYIADWFAHQIRKIDKATDTIRTYVGSGMVGYSGDGGLAVNAKIAGAYSLCIDTSAKALYFTDEYNYRVRKVDMVSGIISTIAGDGVSGYSGEEGLATNARISRPLGICTDKLGNVYFGEWDNACIRKIVISTGIIKKIAGTGITGYSGDGGLAINAMISEPGGLFIDSCGDLFFSDCGLGGGNFRIRKIDGSTGVISTIAGNGIKGFAGDGGPATNAKLSRTNGVCLDMKGNLYVADIENNRIRKVSNSVSSCYLSDNIPLLSNPIISFAFYPNPATESVTINASVAIEHITISNLLGQVVLEQHPTGGKKSVVATVQHLPAGIYVVRVNGIYAGRMVKE